MRKTIIYCDVCGREIKGRVYKIFFGMADVDKVIEDPCFEEVEQEKDFCAECIDNVAQLIDTFAQPALEETEEPKPVEKPKKQKAEKADKDKRKKVDAGKVWALYDANWGTADIAAEMMCSCQTVRNILAKERPDMEVSNA